MSNAALGNQLVRVLQEQRNNAMDVAADMNAQLLVAQERIAELEKKLAELQPPAQGKEQPK